VQTIQNNEDGADETFAMQAYEVNSCWGKRKDGKPIIKFRLHYLR
jgi:hypothetical protein